MRKLQFTFNHFYCWEFSCKVVQDKERQKLINEAEKDYLKKKFQVNPIDNPYDITVYKFPQEPRIEITKASEGTKPMLTESVGKREGTASYMTIHKWIIHTKDESFLHRRVLAYRKQDLLDFSEFFHSRFEDISGSYFQPTVNHVYTIQNGLHEKQE